jgi:hypothetical protein
MKYIHEFTVWNTQGIDTYSQPSWSAPIHVRGREEKKVTLFLNAQGREERGSSRIYLETDVARLGGHVVRGTSDSSTPTALSKEIKDARAIPNLRGTREEYRVVV